VSYQLRALSFFFLLDELSSAAERLRQADIEHGEVKELTNFNNAILSFSDPDGIHLELSAPL
jgi:hypothetical protein